MPGVNNKYLIEDKILLRLDRSEDIYNKGLDAYNIQDYSRAFEQWVISAGNGHINSIIKLGHCYNNGFGVKQNYESAVKWFLIAAEMEDGSAQNYVGYAYTQGQGVKVNEKEAVYWFRKSAERGDPVGISNLAECYRDGYGGIEQDFTKAEELYNKAINAGFEGAKEELEKLNEMREKVKVKS
jgi:TPR repeat protein